MKKIRLHIINASRLISKNKKRPILEGLHYKDNYIYLTDGYFAVKVETGYTVSQPFTISLDNGGHLAGTYPDVERFLSLNSDMENITKEDVKIEIMDNVEYYNIKGKYFHRPTLKKHFKVLNLDFDSVDVRTIKIHKDTPRLLFNYIDYTLLSLGMILSE